MAKAYDVVLKISDELRNSTYERTVMHQNFVANGLKRGYTGVNTVSVRSLKWTNVDITFMKEDKLSMTARGLCLKIIEELKMYNMLWSHPIERNGNTNKAIKELVDAAVIYRTEVPGIYIVNPVKIWRGDPILATEETKELLRIHKKPSVDIITDRRPSDKYEHTNEADRFNLMAGDNPLLNNQSEAV
jgi:hypothetical protein